MSNKEKMVWCFGAGILVLLFLLSSTDLIIKEQKREVYRISVIIADSRDEYYVNFKKGMDKAALSFQADVNFITLYAANDEEQQAELLQRELRDGAQAVVLAPVNESGMLMRLDAVKPNCPVILLGSATLNDSVAASLSVDGYAMGQELGRQVASRAQKEIPVCLLTEGLSFTGNADIYDGLRSVLDEEGFVCRLVERQGEGTYRQVIEETVYPGSGRITVIALDTAALSEAADLLAGSSVYQEHVAGLYGVGCTVGILNRLDEGIVKGLMAYNQFDEGYLSVRLAVEAIQGLWPGVQNTLDFHYIEAKELRKELYEKMLYPME
ncbi:MAG: sugar ABC transporter substrate-binding protein [Lachnospiraceae bacterium]|nr:sugar ABC transporter substrate-binding protein [Lachnospiraceae bacterium]